MITNSTPAWETWQLSEAASQNKTRVGDVTQFEGHASVPSEGKGLFDMCSHF